jgi:MFS family permease
VALAILCTAQFVDVLDVNVVLVALPAIGRDLGLAPAELQWVVTAYALVFAGFLLLAGRAADQLGPRRVFLAGIAVFTLASLASGLARDPVLLVCGRAVQGLGAAITAPAALAIITTTFREGRDRDRAVGAWTAVAAAGGATGLVAGGVITDWLGWPWVFFINVPVGLAALGLAPRVLPADQIARARGPLDLPGATTVTAGLALLVFSFSCGERAGLGSVLALTALALSAALLAGFLSIERRVEDPLLPLRIFRSRELVSSTFVAGVLTATTSAGGVLATLYLQGVLGYSPALAGLAALPLSLSVIAGAAAGPRCIRWIGPRPTMSWGLLGVCAGALVATRISAAGGLGYVLVGGVFEGFGLGLASVAATAGGTAAVPAGRRGLVSGVLTTAAQVGTAVGVSLLVWVAGLRTEMVAGGQPAPDAVVAGYRWGFFAAAGIAALAALIARRGSRPEPAARAATRARGGAASPHEPATPGIATRAGPRSAGNGRAARGGRPRARRRTRGSRPVPGGGSS